MCRLYGFRCTHRTRVGCNLVAAQNAILCQSRLDSLGRCHGDGWGLAYYRGGVACIDKRPTAAFDDARFDETARRIRSKTMLAHVRLASVGSVNLANTHPFRFRNLTFVHNGTLTGIDHRLGKSATAATLRDRLLGGLTSDLHPDRRRIGRTDSELIFRHLTSRLLEAGLLDASGINHPRKAARLVGQQIATLDRWNDRAGQGSATAVSPAKLNVVLTDGRTMIATRLRHDLHLHRQSTPFACDVCGQMHVDVGVRDRYAAASVASEPIGRGDWELIPDGSLVLVDPDLNVTLSSL